MFLMAIIEPKRVEGLREEIESGVKVIDFWATWCGPCRMLEPIVNELGENHDIIKLDVDQWQEMANYYGVMSVPTLILLHDGKEIDRTSGFKPKEELEKFITQ